jgi:hypothetical protein
VKIRPLPDIDLARIASLPKDKQLKPLQQMRIGHPPFSYGPFRTCSHDIFNVQPGLFGPVSPTDFSVVERQLKKKCKSDEELKANLAVARGLHQFATEAAMLGRVQEFFPLGMGAGQKVSYWLPMVLSYEGRALVPFIDPRRSRGLTAEARRFVFSMMHERIRAADPDFEAVSFAIFQFGEFNEDRRSPRLHMDDGVTLFSLDELEAMVATTYELWSEVCEERDTEERRKSTGTRGSLI